MGQFLMNIAYILVPTLVIFISNVISVEILKHFMLFFAQAICSVLIRAVSGLFSIVLKQTRLLLHPFLLPWS